MTQAATNPGSIPAAATPPAPNPYAGFSNLAEWLHSLGDIPLERVVADPAPGTATEQDLLRMVEREDRLVELVDGTLVEKPMGSKESLIASYLASALIQFTRPRKLGAVYGPDLTLKTNLGRIRLPDVTFVSRADLPAGKLPDISVPTMPPTLAVEVISESNTRKEMQLKLKEYFDSGSKLVWMIYPKTKTIAVFEQLQDEPTRTLTESDTLDGGTVLPGFTIPVSEIFEPLSSGF